MAHSGTALINPHIVFEKIGLAPGMRVADLGCGRTGHFVFSASRAVGDKGIVYAVDVIKDILESIKSRVRSEGYDNVQTVWSDLEQAGKTPIPGDSLDVGFMVNVMFLIKDKLAALKEAARLLKDGGYLVIVEWARKLGPLGPDDGRRVAPELLASLARQAPLTPVETMELGDYHYASIFKKT